MGYLNIYLLSVEPMVSEHVDNLQGSLHCLRHVSFCDLTQDVNFLHLGTLPVSPGMANVCVGISVESRHSSMLM